MITLKIKNFRSTLETKIELSPITVLYGPNGSGKSSILYSLLVLRNVVLNPNQSIDGFFNLNFANLGGFEQVIFDHAKEDEIQLEIGYKGEEGRLEYGVTLGKKSSFCIFSPEFMESKVLLPVSFPYAANAKTKIHIPGETVTEIDVTDQGPVEIPIQQMGIDLEWNGITVQSPSEVPPDRVELVNRATKFLNKIPELLRKVDMIPLKRGFSKPSYSPVPLTPYAFQEDEVATLLAQDRYLEGKVQSYCRDIFDKTFQIRPQLGTGIFYPQVVDRKGLTSEIVNEGFGLNQTIILLGKILRRDTSVLCLEEPEIHLHPSTQSKLAKAFIRAVNEENKTIIMSTHSEHIVSSLLSSVVKGEIESDKLSCYLCTKPQKQTEIKKQSVNEKGQIEGGLSSFIEAEVENLRNMLKIKE